MKQITHRGEVRQVEAGVVHVAIVASGACHTCRAREFCGMSEQQEKIIDVRTSEALTFRVGEEVTVSEEQRMGLKAVLWAYVGAFIVLILLLILALHVGFSEGWAALISLLGVGFYYGGVYLFRNRIEKTIYFTIKKN